MFFSCKTFYVHYKLHLQKVYNLKCKQFDLSIRDARKNIVKTTFPGTFSGLRMTCLKSTQANPTSSLETFVLLKTKQDQLNNYV